MLLSALTHTTTLLSICYCKSHYTREKAEAEGGQVPEPSPTATNDRATAHTQIILTTKPRRHLLCCNAAFLILTSVLLSALLFSRIFLIKSLECSAILTLELSSNISKHSIWILIKVAFSLDFHKYSIFLCNNIAFFSSCLSFLINKILHFSSDSSEILFP